MIKNENEQKQQKPRLFELWDQIIGNRDQENKEKEDKEK